MRKRISAIVISTAILAAGCSNMAPSIETLPNGTAAQSSAAPGTTAASIAASSTAQEASSEAISSAAESSSEALPQTTEAQASSEVPQSSSETAGGEYAVADGYTAVAQVVKATANVNLRLGPGTTYDSAGILPEGSKISRVSIGGDWSQCIYNGKCYYIASQYLELITDGETLAASETPAASSAASADPQPVQVTDYKGMSVSDISALGISNDTVPYGFGAADRDDANRPNGVLYYNKLYGQYGVNFIAPEAVGNTIYLTMDEGYEAGYTPTILDTLKAKNVKAVFFLTKQFVTEHPELVTRMIEEGHVLGNHSCAHPANGMPSLGIQGEYDDVMWLQNYVQENFGYTMELFRYPSGIFSAESLALMNSLDLTPVFWSFAYADWDTTNQPDVASSLQSALDQLHPGAIYLLHAVSATNTAFLGDWIDGARAKGYEFGVYPKSGF